MQSQACQRTRERRAAITPDIALKLERVVGIPALTWLKYETRYRSELALLEQEYELVAHADRIAPEAATYLRNIGVTTATKRNPGKLVSDFLTTTDAAPGRPTKTCTTRRQRGTSRSRR